MQEFFFTIITIWVLWKLFNVFSSSREQKTSQQFYQTNHNHYHPKQEGDVTIQQSEPKHATKAADDAEYTDYEEIK